jgi:excisionase family DNA binding protein
MSARGRDDSEGSILDDVISAREAAEILGITQRHVTRLAESGELLAKRLGRDWIIIRQSVLDYKAKKKAQK